MKTKTINVYEYSELNDKAKEKVLSYFRKDNDNPFLQDNLNESLNELLKKNKIKVINSLKSYYSLNNCQGDGFCFIGLFKWGKYNIEITHTNNHYYHSNSTTIELLDKNGKYVGEVKDYSKFKDIYKDICKVLEKQGYDEIEYNESEETIKDLIEANEYEFNKDGSIFRG